MVQYFLVTGWKVVLRDCPPAGGIVRAQQPAGDNRMMEQPGSHSEYAEKNHVFMPMHYE
jgi:hypothetical protein